MGSRVSKKTTWTVDQPVWLCSVMANGATVSHAGIVTEVDEETVKAKTIRPPDRYETFDINGEAREFKHSRLPDRWLIERRE